MENERNVSNFGGQLGFVLAAAGSAVGLGNLWRFPYLAAQDGGGLFVVIYLILAVTFGFTMLTTDIVIGRKTGRSSIFAYAAINPKWKFLGILVFIVPVLIMTYYGVIGGWVTKYTVSFLMGQVHETAQEGFFTDFITSPFAPVIFGLIFVFFTSVIVFCGVNEGIEKSARIIMPVLLVLMIAVSLFSLTLSYTDETTGVTRTGLDGLAVYLIPNFDGMTLGKFFQVLLDAMIQLFFSLSIAMGIMITYGSYVKKDVNLNRSINHIEIFDTGIALLAGLMIIPSVFVFSGAEGMSSGPGLLFVSLPKVFDAMGWVGVVVGAVFFIAVFFAALTSCVSILEAITANCMEVFKASRKKVTLILTVIYFAATVAVSFGYSYLYFEAQLPNGSTGQLLDIMDYISNSFMMPLVSFLTCILIGWVVGPAWATDEIESTGHKFRRKKMYVIMIKFVAPVMMFILFLQSTGILGKLLG